MICISYNAVSKFFKQYIYTKNKKICIKQYRYNEDISCLVPSLWPCVLRRNAQFLRRFRTLLSLVYSFVSNNFRADEKIQRTKPLSAI